MRHFRRCAGLSAPFLLLTASFAAVPAMAQNVADRDVKPEDIPMQPLRDLNIDSDRIPPLLIDVANDPYSNQGLQTCADIEQAVADLDTLLGTDVDLPVEKSDVRKGANSVGRLAASFVGGLIPFRGIVREISGARADQRQLEEMVAAGLIRRGFLKGIGLQRGCPWPARPASGVVEFDEQSHKAALATQNPAAPTEASGTAPTTTGPATSAGAKISEPAAVEPAE